MFCYDYEYLYRRIYYILMICIVYNDLIIIYLKYFVLNKFIWLVRGGLRILIINFLNVLNYLYIYL